MKVLIVVPSLTGDVSLGRELKKQSLQDFQLKIVKGVRPNGKARNVGWKGTKEKIVIFIDDDATLGHKDVIKNLIEPIKNNKADIVGASRILPEDSNWFARWASSQIPLIESPIVEKLTDANPTLVKKSELDKSTWSVITTTCCAVSKEVLNKTNGFDERLLWGVDSQFFYRARKMGFRFAVVPNTWVYHPYVSNFSDMWKKYFKSGIGTAQEVMLNPERKLKMKLKTLIHTCLFLIYRLFTSLVFVLAFRPLRGFAIFASTIGYIYGWYFRRIG